jgi:hypothetical protein
MLRARRGRCHGRAIGGGGPSLQHVARGARRCLGAHVVRRLLGGARIRRRSAVDRHTTTDRRRSGTSAGPDTARGARAGRSKSVRAAARCRDHHLAHRLRRGAHGCGSELLGVGRPFVGDNRGRDAVARGRSDGHGQLDVRRRNRRRRRTPYRPLQSRWTADRGDRGLHGALGIASGRGPPAARHAPSSRASGLRASPCTCRRAAGEPRCPPSCSAGGLARSRTWSAS